MKKTILIIITFLCSSVVLAQKTSDSVEDRIYDVVEQMPRFPGGADSLSVYMSKVPYPKELAETGIQGRVILSFIVRKDGKVTDPVVFRGVDPALDKIAMNHILRMPRWIPGIQNGRQVDVRYSLPVTFRAR